MLEKGECQGRGGGECHGRGGGKCHGRAGMGSATEEQGGKPREEGVGGEGERDIPEHSAETWKRYF